jgi:hypothetical protein
MRARRRTSWLLLAVLGLGPLGGVAPALAGPAHSCCVRSTSEGPGGALPCAGPALSGCCSCGAAPRSLAPGTALPHAAPPCALAPIGFAGAAPAIALAALSPLLRPTSPRVVLLL